MVKFNFKIINNNNNNNNIIDFKDEIWKDIKGYEGYYQVSNKGRVKSISRKIVYKNNDIHYVNEKILTPCINKSKYLQVSLYINNKDTKEYIHRLVAKTFISNPDNLPDINHIDENKANNCVENLEWCTKKYNNNYGSHNINAGKNHSISILQYDLKGNFIKEWQSAYKIKESFGYDVARINTCCHNKYGCKTAYGYIWKFKRFLKIQ